MFKLMMIVHLCCKHLNKTLAQFSSFFFFHQNSSLEPAAQIMTRFKFFHFCNKKQFCWSNRNLIQFPTFPPSGFCGFGPAPTWGCCGLGQVQRVDGKWHAKKNSNSNLNLVISIRRMMGSVEEKLKWKREDEVKGRPVNMQSLEALKEKKAWTRKSEAHSISPNKEDFLWLFWFSLGTTNKKRLN